MDAVKRTWIVISLQLALVSAPSSGVTFRNYLHPPLQKRGLGISPELVSATLLGHKVGVTESVRVDLEGGVVSYEMRKGELLLAVTGVDDFPHYFERMVSRRTKETWLQQSKTSLAKRREFGEAGGIIPTIELPPLRIPGLGGVFGEGGELKVDGSQSIQFGGVEHIELGGVDRPGERRSYFPELEMEQRLMVNLQGTVGEKVHVSVQHDSYAESQLQNKIKLQYKGDEDEIVKEIEAGDTQLSLPGVSLIGGPPTHHGLFGIRTMAKVGPLDFTAIASKEQGKAEAKTFLPEAIAYTVERYDTEFERWRFFSFEGPEWEVQGQDVYVFVDDGIDINNEATVVGIYRDPDNPDSNIAGNFDLKSGGTGQFYEFYRIYCGRSNVLKLRNRLDQDREILAVSYIGKMSGITDTVGTVKSRFNPGDTISLWLVKPQRPKPRQETWDYELKNIYSIGSSNIVGGSFRLTIYKDDPSAMDPSSQEGIPFIQLLGLDTDGDGVVEPGFLRGAEGLLWFPDERPFCSDTLDEPDCAIYDTTDLGAGVGRKYKLAMSYSGRATFYHLGLNVIEESEQVIVGRDTLERGRDYNIDYETGMLTFLTSRPFDDPDAQISIKYQTIPFFSLASRSLLGARGVYKFWENSQLATSLLYRSTGRREERPKLGEEPERIVLGEVDGNVSAEPYLFTRAADLLPFVETETPSNFSLTGEVGFSLPDPNTLGEAYLDDMEATEVKERLGGISYGSWSFGSIPDGQDTSSFCSHLLWYNPDKSEKRLRAGDLDSLLPENQRDDLLDVLFLVMTPNQTGTSSWGSLLTLLSETGLDLSESKFLEVWVRGEQGVLKAELCTDIPEDAPRRNSWGEIVGIGDLDTEDKNLDGRLDDDEDTGLDGVRGVDGQNIPGDDGNDDYHYDPARPYDYSGVNGTEVNDRLDTEDLDEYGWLNEARNYCRFSISLADTIFLERKREDTGWKLYKIPLRDSSSVDTALGTLDWQKVRYARLWITGFDAVDSIEIASLEIVGNKWREEGLRWASSDLNRRPPRGETFYVTAKNNYQDPDYTPPFDPGRDSYGILKREQSLVLGFGNLGVNRQGSCYSLKTTPDNYLGYRELRVWVHGDGRSSPTFFIRFGADSLNYYEYKSQLEMGWHEIVVEFQKLVDVKDRLMELSRGGLGTRYLSEGAYGVRGRPALTDVKRVSLGVLNEGEQSIDGEVWVDELRLTGIRREKGASANLALALGFADLLSFNFGVNRSTAEFRGLGQVPSFYNSTRFSGGANLNLSKFLPETWGVSLPLRADYFRGLGYPKYYSGSDIELDAEGTREQSSLSETRQLSLNFSKSRSQNRLLQLILDPITVRNSWRKLFSNRYATVDSSEGLNSTISYDYSPQLKPLKLFNWELSYFPQQIGLSTVYSRNWSRRYDREDTLLVLQVNPRLQRNLNGQGSFTYRPHPTINTNYSLNVIRDLEPEEDTTAGKLGTEIGRTENARASFSPTISNLLSPSISFATNYTERHHPEYDRAPPPQDTIDVRNVDNRNTATLGLTLNLSALVSKVTSLRDESKDSLVGTPHWIAKKIEWLASKFISPTGSYSIDRESQLYYLKERPPFGYRFGLREGVEGIDRIPWDDHTSRAENYSLRSGVSLRSFSLTSNYSKSQTEGGVTGNRTVSRAITWPNLGLRMGPFGSFGPIKLLTDVSLSSDFTSTRDESWQVGKENQITERRSRNFSPLIGVRGTWRKGINSDLNTTYQLSETVNWATDYREIQESRGANFSLTYSFSAPTGLPIPLLGAKIRFKSNLNTSLQLGYSETKQTIPPDLKPRSHRVSYSSKLSADYNFSQSVLGGLDIELGQSRDRKADRGERTVGLSFSVEFKF